MSNEGQKYYLTVFNTCTGVYETVEVTKEVYIGYKRSKWKIENNTAPSINLRFSSVV